MKKYIVFPIVFFYLLIVSVRSDFLSDSCRDAAASNPNIQVNFCVSTLQKNPKAKSATTLADLVKVSFEIAISNTESTGSVISKLLSDKSLEQYVRSCLQDCSELYSDAGSDLSKAQQAIESKDYGTANTVVSAAQTGVETCESQFKEKPGVVSPLTTENEDFLQLTGISLAFINKL